MNLNKRGFLLFEILVSLAIVSGVLLLVMRSFVASQRVLQKGTELFTVSLLLQNRMQELEIQGGAGEGIQTGVFEAHEKFKWTLKSAPLENSALKTVTLEVLRKNGKADTRYVLSTYLEGGSYAPVS